MSKPNFRADALAEQLNLDAAESAFFSRQLEHIRPQAYDVKFETLMARELVPVDHSVPAGAETVTYRSYTQYGQAAMVASYADDFPVADVKGDETTSKIRSIGAAYVYNVQELRAAQMAGVPLSERKALAARRAVEEKLESIARTGDSDFGLLGLLNQSNTTSYTVADGGYGDTEWEGKTSDEILADMHGIVNNIRTTTRGVEYADTLLLPLACYALVSTRRMGDGIPDTILSFFLRTSPDCKTVIPWTALATAGSGSSRRMVAYRRSPEVLNLVIPQEFEQFPPQVQNMAWKTPCHMRTGGVVVYYPLAISYGDHI